MIIHTRIDGNMSIPNLIYDIDAQCTHDLRNGLINGERDFVSNLLGQIRKPFGLLSSFSLGIAYTLPNKIEQKYGCDAIMIFRLDNKDAKIFLTPGGSTPNIWVDMKDAKQRTSTAAE